VIYANCTPNFKSQQLGMGIGFNVVKFISNYRDS